MKFLTIMLLYLSKKNTKINITDKTDMQWILEISKNDNYIKKYLKLEDYI